MKKKIVAIGGLLGLFITILGVNVVAGKSGTPNTIKAESRSEGSALVAKQPETIAVSKKESSGFSVVSVVYINRVPYSVGDSHSLGSTTGRYTGICHGKLALFQWIDDSKSASGKKYVFKDEPKGVKEWKSDYGVPYSACSLTHEEVEYVPTDILKKGNWYWLADKHEKYTAWAYISQYEEAHSIHKDDIGGVSPCGLIPID